MKRLILIFLVLAGACPMANSRISLDECRELARQNSPSIKMYALINATKDYSVSNASLQWVPSIQIGALGGLINNPPQISDLFSNSKHPAISKFIVDEIMRGQMNLKDMPYYSYKVSASLSQSIYDGGASKVGKKVAQAEAQLETADQDVTLAQVCDRVDEIYFSILLLEKRILQIDSKMQVVEAAKDKLTSLSDMGVSRQDEAYEMEAVRIESEQQKAGLESSLKSFRVALSLLTGEDLMTEELLMPSAPLQPQTVPQALLLDRRMSLLELEKAKLDVAVRPRLDLVADAYYGFPNRNIYKDFAFHIPGLNAFVGFRFIWNVSAFYTRKNDLAIITKSMDKINVQKEILRLDTRLSNNAVNTEIERLNKCLEHDNDLVDIRERLRKSAELSFSEGEIDTDKLLSKIDEEYQARLNAQIHEIEMLRELFKLKEDTDF